MKAQDIHTIEQMQRFIEGCINDYEVGIDDKETTIQHLEDYTSRLLEINEKHIEILLAPEKELDPLLKLYRKEHPQGEFYLPDKTKFYKWIRKKIKK